MRIEYNPRKFLLLVPLPVLREYFDKRSLLGDLAWDGLKDQDYETPRPLCLQVATWMLSRPISLVLRGQGARPGDQDVEVPVIWHLR